MTQQLYATVQSGLTQPDSLASNWLLSALPSQELELLRPHASLVPLQRHDVLYQPNARIERVFFPVDGIVSLVCLMKNGGGVETATIGREGMVGTPVFHGVVTPSQQAIVQVPGHSYCVDAATFQELLPKLPTLSALLHRFSVVLFTLAAQNSGCNRKHSIEERCCRWMLMVADRLDRDSFDLTHDFIAQMLGVRRASVTEALGSLEKRGLVRTARGRITLVDRAGLEQRVCECYEVIRGAVQGLLNGNGSGNGNGGRATV